MSMDDDELAFLDEAGLRFSSDSEGGIVRRRAGRGFTYRRRDGSRVSDDATLERIAALAIPPAWTDVWICRTGNGHLQATGRDDRGRKQYRYHDEWRRLRDESKFASLSEFGAGLAGLRTTIEADLALRGLPQRKVVALVIALLDRTLIRVGNDEYRRENGTYGLTTMLSRHVALDGSSMQFRFTGKGGIEQRVRMDDRRLAGLVRRCHELGGREIFSYVDGDGEPRRVDSTECNDYLRDVLGFDTTVKTFRAWGASATALEHLVQHDGEVSDAAVLDAIDAAAERLGNTRAVARRSYVHPAVPRSFLESALGEVWAGARRTDRMTRPERALVRLLDDGG